MTRPLLVDLFCGAGGAAMGYHRAGFDIIGIDHRPQPNYPFPFIRADALGPIGQRAIARADVVHASPPCQAHTQMAATWRIVGGSIQDDRQDLLTPTRSMLADESKPWVIENVPGAGSLMATTVVLHGGMFGLQLHRPRRFESNTTLLTGRAAMAREPIGVYGDHPQTTYRTRANGDMKGKRSIMRTARSIAEAQTAMRIDWMPNWRELCEAIPPAYTEHIGHQLMAAL